MPAYISHAIMGEELFNEGIKDEKLFKSEVDKDALKTYACAIDLAEAKNHFTNNPHSYRTQDFLLSMIKYIKENNLTENKVMLAYLYGHISHYFFDTNAHPLIYYIEKGCTPIGLISPHNLTEGYISAYLTTKLLNKDIMDVKRTYWNQADFNNSDIKNIVKTLYGSIYNDPKIINSYKLFKKVFTLVEWTSKETIVSKSLLIKFFSFDRFLQINNLSTEEIHNESNNLWLHPVTGEKHYESIIVLYKKALEQTLYSINEVNKYLYGNLSLSSLESVFPNISYETGLSISLGENMTYTRKPN